MSSRACSPSASARRRPRQRRRRPPAPAAPRTPPAGWPSPLALVIGGLGFRLLVLRRPAAEVRAPLLSRHAGGSDRSRRGRLRSLPPARRRGPPATALDVPLRGLAADRGHAGRDGVVAMTLAFVLVIALIFLAWLTSGHGSCGRHSRSPSPSPRATRSGHSAAESNASRWSQLADWVHLTAASLWAEASSCCSSSA